MIGLNPDTFGNFILITMFASFTCILLGLAISASVPTVEAANVLGPLFIIIGIIFGGYFLRIGSLPIILEWIPYMSLFQWAYRALMTNEFQGLTFTCVGLDPSQCITTGEEVLKALDFDGHSTSYAVFGLAMLMLAHLSLLYTILDFSGSQFTSLGHSGWKYIAHKDRLENNRKSIDTVVDL